MRVDANQWPTINVVNSVNNWLDLVAGYAIGADRKFQWDDTNHTKLPIGTTNLVANQSEYSFLTDEQNNKILTLTRIDVQDPGGIWHKVIPIDQAQIPVALDEFNKVAGIPQFYDKTGDNIIKLYPKPNTSVTGGLKFYFQRAPSYFAVADTTKEPGVPSPLHRGAVIAASYDGAMTLGLSNLQIIANEMQREMTKMQDFYADRNMDEMPILSSAYRTSR
jgi:hypothetical protein